jgi:hypothetical protein
MPSDAREGGRRGHVGRERWRWWLKPKSTRRTLRSLQPVDMRKKATAVQPFTPMALEDRSSSNRPGRR